jgi:hypothetical protein
MPVPRHGDIGATGEQRRDEAPANEARPAGHQHPGTVVSSQPILHPRCVEIVFYLVVLGFARPRELVEPKTTRWPAC